MEEKILNSMENVVESTDVVEMTKTAGSNKGLIVLGVAAGTLALVAIGKKVTKVLKNKKAQAELQETADEDLDDDFIDEEIDSEEDEN